MSSRLPVYGDGQAGRLAATTTIKPDPPLSSFVKRGVELLHMMDDDGDLRFDFEEGPDLLAGGAHLDSLPPGLSSSLFPRGAALRPPRAGKWGNGVY